MKEIREMVCNVFSVTEEEFLSPKKNREFVDARRAYCTIMFRNFNYGWSSLARDINRTHASIINLETNHDMIYSHTENYRELYDICEGMALISRQAIHDSEKEILVENKIKILEEELEKQKNIRYSFLANKLKLTNQNKYK